MKALFLVLLACLLCLSWSATETAGQGTCSSLTDVHARVACEAGGGTPEEIGTVNEGDDISGDDGEEGGVGIDAEEVAAADDEGVRDAVDDNPEESDESGEDAPPSAHGFLFMAADYVGSLFAVQTSVPDFAVRMGCVVLVVFMFFFEVWHRVRFGSVGDGDDDDDDDDDDADGCEGAGGDERGSKKGSRRRAPVEPRTPRADLPSVPVHRGPVLRDRYAQDFLSVGRCVPPHRTQPKPTWSRTAYVSRGSTAHAGAAAAAVGYHGHSNFSSSSSSSAAAFNGHKKGAYIGDEATVRDYPHCMPGSRAAAELHALFPDADECEVVRFLVARKGSVEQAATMLSAARRWHASHFPSELRALIPALKTGCFFAHGAARDGTPTLYFRGALYDSKAATPMQYALAAAYVIDRALAASTQTAVTVMVHVRAAPGAPNEPADVTFIKNFVKVLSDNYPERLRRLVLYPFPFFGRFVWSLVRVFVDKRSQDKVCVRERPRGSALPAVW